MHAMSRRGFTLAEILVGLLLTGIVGTAVIRALTGTQRGTSAQFARIDAQESARAVNYYMQSALRELDASEGDVRVANSTTLEFRGMAWTGMSCTAVTVVGGNLRIVVKNTQLFGRRAPDASLDSILVYNENDPGIRTDDVWLVGAISATAGGTCADLSAGTRLTLAISAASGGNAAAVAGFVSGGPIRGFQTEEISLYDDGAGAYWLGQRTMDNAGTWSAIEPLAGPLTSTGLALAYYDTLNAVTATLADIASVGVTIRTQSRDIARGSAGINTNIQDSLLTRIALRNNVRY